MARWRAAVLALASSGPLAAAAGAAEGCRAPGGREQPPVAHLVSAVGEVTVRGAAQPGARGALPFVPICTGDLVTVGSASRAAVYLIGADTPLRLDEDTVGRILAPPGPGSGLVELARGAVYFLSQVRRTLTIRTPYVNAGIEGTEVYLRVRDPATPAAPAAELIVLEGRVAVTPGAESGTAFAPETVGTGERVEVAAAGPPRRTTLPSPGGPFGALREVAVGELSWTLFYPDVLTEPEAAAFPRVAAAARLLAAGQVAEAEAALAGTPAVGAEAGLRDALLAIVAVGRKDAAAATKLAERAVAGVPGSAVPRLALSYARQLATDLDGAFAAAEEAARLAPREPLPQARLAEIHLMRGETRAARRAADEAVELGGGPLAQLVLGYAELAALRGARGEAAFRRALQEESWNPLALLGLGLAQIKQGDLGAGTVQIENAVAHDPGSSLLRSYLGKVYFEDRRDELAGTQYAIAKELDPTDPTPWLYDAIRKQLDNRPIEALRELEKSIELNDNRVVYRSRLLLDSDLATRGTSLARIYDNLGFKQLGVNEAAQSLALDPANSAAHRFLSDLYVGKPRLEAARVSELLQAQLLQPVGRNPIQPRLAFTDLDVVARSGPAQVTFNEFTPLFTRDGVQVNAAGVAGTDSTFGNEAAVTGLLGRTSISVGQLHYQTEGFRENNDLQNNIYTLFGQSDVTEKFSLQTEYRHRDTDTGDRALNFDLDDFDPSFSDNIREDVFRIGGRVTPAPGQVGVVSGIYTDREDNINSEIPGREQDRHTNVGQIEAQYLGAFGPLRTVAGAGWVVADSQDHTPSRFIARSREERRASDIYLSANLGLTPRLDVTTRLGYVDVDIEPKDNQGESFDGTQTGTETLTPGLGVIWQPSDVLLLRAAAGRTVKQPYVANQSLQPTQLAGFNERFDDLDGTRANWFGLAADVRASEAVRLGAETTLRRLAVEMLHENGRRLEDQRDDRAMAYLYWTPTDQIAASLELIGEYYSAEERDSPEVLRVQTLTVPFQLAYFASAGWFATARPALVMQDVELPDAAGQNTDLDSHGLLIDLAAGYRLPNRRGIIALEVANLLDEDLAFQDESFRTSRGQVDPRFVPSQMFLVSITLNF